MNNQAQHIDYPVTEQTQLELPHAEESSGNKNDYLSILQPKCHNRRDTIFSVLNTELTNTALLLQESWTSPQPTPAGTYCYELMRIVSASGYAGVVYQSLKTSLKGYCEIEHKLLCLRLDRNGNGGM
ncbi:hypothetical protein O181_009778 [Austropuccinia psidii MF-1]|uniref:Uncharacterized protein n=1 Tax=Austropuccinia psidii MF-1 TaxID=1389203 RepID=A0A9Q3GJR5_9BASI|nr:hypothetical protein [Austropuccinia psidii MF-1]